MSQIQGHFEVQKKPVVIQLAYNALGYFRI